MSAQGTSVRDDKKWMGRPGIDVYAVYKEQLNSWALGRGKLYAQVLSGRGKLGKLKYTGITEDDEDSSDDDIARDKDKITDRAKLEPGSKDPEKQGQMDADIERKADNTKALKRRQRKYNRVSAELHSRIMATLGPGPIKALITHRVTTGDARAAILALDHVYGKANPLELPASFEQLLEHNVSAQPEFKEYRFDFTQTVASIDANPGMKDYQAGPTKHCLPDALLNALFLRGLTSAYEPICNIIRATKPNERLEDIVEDVSSYHNTSVKTRGASGVHGAAAHLGRIDLNGRPSPAPKKICFNWLKRGTCKFGDKCRYSHDPEKKGKGSRPREGNRDVGQRYDRDESRGRGNSNVSSSCNSETTSIRTGTPRTGSAPSTPDQKLQSYYAIYNGADGFKGIVNKWGEAYPKVKDKEGKWREGVECRKFPSLDQAESYLFYLQSRGNSESYHTSQLHPHIGELGEHTKPRVGDFPEHTDQNSPRPEILDTGTNVHTRIFSRPASE